MQSPATDAVTLDSAPKATDRIETEWQFDAIDLRAVERWIRAHTGLARPADASALVPSVRPEQPLEIEDTYLDTDDWRIHRAGYTLRVRRSGVELEATLKSTAPADAALRRRREITQSLAGTGLESLRQGDGPVAERLAVLAGSRPIRPIMEIRTKRQPFLVEIDGAHAGEITLDETAIAAGDGGEPARLRRVEVELHDDPVGALSAFVRLMQGQLRLQPALLSKFEAGILAAGAEPAARPDFGATDIDSSKTIGEVAFAVLRRHFAVFLEKEGGTRLGEDIEELHDMRVASRRLRAALALFADVIPVRAARFRSEFGWVAQALGAVRDLDVELDQLRSWITDAEEPDRDPLGALASFFEDERGRARRTVLRTLDSKRYERLVSGFSDMLRRGPLRTSRLGRAPVIAVAPDLVSARYRKVRKAGDRIRKRSPSDAYHRLRIRCKRLRYALEFFADVYDGSAHKPIRRLVALQDVLGLHQDARVAVARLRELATAGPSDLSPATVFAMGQVAERYRRQEARQRARFPAAYRKVRGRPWRGLREVMERQRASVAARPGPARVTAGGAAPDASGAG